MKNKKKISDPTVAEFPLPENPTITQDADSAMTSILDNMRNAFAESLYNRSYSNLDNRNVESTCGGSSATPYAYAFKSTPTMPTTPKYTDIEIGGFSLNDMLHKLDYVTSEIVKTHRSRTQLDKIRKMTAGELAEFVLVTCRTYLSGVGDPKEELVEWLNSEI